MDATIIFIFSCIILVLVTGLKLIIFSHLLITSERYRKVVKFESLAKSKPLYEHDQGSIFDWD